MGAIYRAIDLEHERHIAGARAPEVVTQGADAGAKDVDRFGKDGRHRAPAARVATLPLRLPPRPSSR